MVYERYLRWRAVPADGPIELSVIVPALNEATRILPTIGAICAHLCARELAWELVVVDDGSTDGTAALVDGLQMANGRVVRHAGNAGKGIAVRTGMVAARAPLMLITDADYPTSMAELDGFLAAAAAGADMVIGSRPAAAAASQRRSLTRRLMSATSRRVIRSVTRLRVDDAMCGFKLVTRRAADRLVPSMTVASYAYDVEMLCIARRRGLRVEELPVSWVAAPGSKVRPGRDGMRFLRDLARIRSRALAGAYRGG